MLFLFPVGFALVFGILFGLGAACLYATVVLVNKFIKNVEGIHRTFVQFVGAAVVLLPYVLLTEGIHLGALDASGWVNLVIVGVVHTGVTYCLYFSALKDLPGQKAAILSYIDPLVAVLVSVTVLGETMTLLQAAGGVDARQNALRGGFLIAGGAVELSCTVKTADLLEYLSG